MVGIACWPRVRAGIGVDRCSAISCSEPSHASPSRVWIRRQACFATIINALSTSFAMLLAGRSLEGLAGAILPLCVGLVRENISKERVPMALSFAECFLSG